jgi:hypothetical protein
MAGMDALPYFLPIIFVGLAALLVLAAYYAASALRIKIRLVPMAELGVAVLIAVTLWFLLVPNS